MGALHGSTISGAIFVIGFLLSATISDYKEAERIPAEAASTIQDMFEDATAVHSSYPKFNLKGYRAQLLKVAQTITADFRNSKSHEAETELFKLSELHAGMEKAGVPANFIVKLKQQQSTLTRNLFRVNYIQRIIFIPSATILAWSIVAIASATLMFTKVEPYIGGLMLCGAIFFILVYVLQLIEVIKTPFHDEGKTKDDVSLFLLEETIQHLEDKRR